MTTIDAKPFPPCPWTLLQNVRGTKGGCLITIGLAQLFFLDHLLAELERTDELPAGYAMELDVETAAKTALEACKLSIKDLSGLPIELINLADQIEQTAIAKNEKILALLWAEETDDSKDAYTARVQADSTIPDAPEGWTLTKHDSPGVMRFTAAYWREDAEYKILWSSHERRYVVALPDGNAIKDPLVPMIASGGLMWFATFEEAARAGDKKTVKHVSNGSPEAKYRFRQYYLIARNVEAVIDSFQKSYGAGAVANEVEVRVGDRWVRAADAPPASC